MPRLWLPLTALLVLGCSDVLDEMTAPAANLPNHEEVSLDSMVANLETQAGASARCVQLVHVSETGVLSSRQRGSSCSCSPNRLVSVTAVIWNGAAGNTIAGRAQCTGGFSTVVAGPATAVDPAGGLGGLFGLAAVGGRQLSGAPGCTLHSTVSSARDRSIRFVTCTWH